MRVGLIAAVGRNGVIGLDDKLVWRNSLDMARFKKLTMDSGAVIMGRSTYDSLGRPLSGRTNIVLSRGREISSSGVFVARNLQEAFMYLRDKEFSRDRKSVV